jgi:hypothetical protein
MDQVDPDPVSRELIGQRLNKTHEAMLGGDVVRHVLPAHQPGDRVGEDHKAPRPSAIVDGTTARTVNHAPVM